MKQSAHRILRRGRWLFMAAVVVVLVAVMCSLWVVRSQSLSDTEQAMVGTWRTQIVTSQGNTTYFYELRPDRTCTINHIDPTTGQMMTSPAGHDWRLQNDELTVRNPEGAHDLRWQLFGLARSVSYVMTLVPDGKDQFQYTSRTEIGNHVSPTPAGTLTRVEP